MVARIIPVEPFDLVIFGGTGDLARRKILPGLYRRLADGQMPDDAHIIGAARGDLSDDEFRQMVRETLTEFMPAASLEPGMVEQFLSMLVYVKVDATGEEGWSELKSKMRPATVQAFYFSVAPTLFGPIAERLKDHGIANSKSRIVVEKPFGKDLESARAEPKSGLPF